MTITWTNELSVGDEKLDAQHKRLIAALNKLKEELQGNVDIGSLRDFISFLHKHSFEHLEDEEAYMKKHGFPGLRDHQVIHESFREYLNTFTADFNKAIVSDTFTSKDITQLMSEGETFLSNWLKKHILEEDHKYYEYVKEHK